MEDPSSIWYDNLEQMRKDYADMKEVYDIVNAVNREGEPDAAPQDAIVIEEEEKNPAKQASSGFKSRQYDHFVKMRGMSDLWGRCLLLKPDRKYKQRKFLISHKYFVHDVFKNLFAVSMLEDEDFEDYQQVLQTLES
jgi:hypothetical protein